MKIILISIGTQGDMEPFLAIGKILKEKGHHVICAVPDQFRNLVEDSTMEFASLGTKFIEMLDSDVGKAAMGGSGSGLKKFFAYLKLARNSTEINKELIKKQYELIESKIPDRIVYNGKAIYPIIWGINNRGKYILVSPVPYLHYVKNHTHVAFNSNYGSLLNKLTYSLANFGLVITVMISVKWLKLTGKITRKQIQHALLSNKVIYTISPALFPRPDYWNKNIKVLGYHGLNEAINWQSNKDLNDFLEKHKNNRILFITFGSMTNPEPEKKTNIIIEILERNKIPAIINTASGGLVKPDKFDSELLHFVSRIPYNWIFPKIYGVIHHGGSGTTHLALKYGCATMTIPHIIDQFVWNKIIDKIGAGPKGIRINKITTQNLEPKILELVNNTSFKKKAEKVASQMEKEDFREELYNSIVE
jgi:UDP:flavonoid glycosyltransferase YjiC (YdhE family)